MRGLLQRSICPFVSDKGCYIREEQIVTTTEAFTTTEAVMKTTCEPVKSNCSKSVSSAKEMKPTSCSGETAAIIVLIVTVLVLVVILFLSHNRRVRSNIPCLQNLGNFFIDCNNYCHLLMKRVLIKEKTYRRVRYHFH